MTARCLSHDEFAALARDPARGGAPIHAYCAGAVARGQRENPFDPEGETELHGEWAHGRARAVGEALGTQGSEVRDQGSEGIAYDGV